MRVYTGRAKHQLIYLDRWVGGDGDGLGNMATNGRREGRYSLLGVEEEEEEEAQVCRPFVLV